MGFLVTNHPEPRKESPQIQPNTHITSRLQKLQSLKKSKFSENPYYQYVIEKLQNQKMNCKLHLLQYQYVKSKVTKLQITKPNFGGEIFLRKEYFSPEYPYYYCNFVTYIYIYIIYNNLQVTNMVTNKVTKNKMSLNCNFMGRIGAYRCFP